MGTLDVYRALWRHKLLVGILTALVVAAAWGVTSRQEKVYQASVLVRVQQNISDPGQTLGVLTAGAQLAETYARIVKTATVSERIRTVLGGEVPFRDIDVSASAVQGLDLLWIDARSTDPVQAQAVANAAPTALSGFIRSTGTLRDHVITVERAGLPSAPVAPNLKLNLALALLAGLILNGAVAIFLELLGDRVLDADELEQLTGKPVLATVPTLRFAHRRAIAAVPARAPTTSSSA